MLDEWKNNVALTLPYHEGKWSSKFGWIPCSSSGGDSMTDRWRDDPRKNNIALAYPYHEGKWCSKFGLILESGLGGDSWMDDGHMDQRTEK